MPWVFYGSIHSQGSDFLSFDHLNCHKDGNSPIQLLGDNIKERLALDLKI